MAFSDPNSMTQFDQRVPSGQNAAEGPSKLGNFRLPSRPATGGPLARLAQAVAKVPHPPRNANSKNLFLP